MVICPDCRQELPCHCGWKSIDRYGVADFLSSKDRSSAETASYIETYDLLAERNTVVPVDSDRYVENMARNFVSFLGDVSGKDVCDVGAGRGYFIKHVLSRFPASVTAVDIAAPSLRNVAETYPVKAFLANAENLPFERHFDVLAATDILEHVLNTSNFLVCANWALRDGGVLAIRVPFIENMIAYSNFHGLPVHYTHLRTFDKPILVDMIESAGFKVAKLRYDGFLADWTQKYLHRMPRVRNWVVCAVKRYFGHADDVTNIPSGIGRLFLKPIEIGVIATKVEHLKVANVHESLTKFKQEFRRSA